MRFCPNCGAQLGDQAKFCTQCGRKMPEIAPVAPAAPVQQAPAAPVYEAPAAPVQQAPAAPVYEAPAAPVQQAPAAPVYEAPAAPVEEEATQFVYAAPAAPAYEAPAAPAYEAPAAPAYEAPAAPAYEAPAAPVYEAPAAPVYEAPVQQSYQPPVDQSYQAPVGGTYVPPAAPKAPKKSGKKGKGGMIALIGGIAVVAIAVVILLISLLGGGGKVDEAYLGLYNATACTSEGLDLGVDDEWIELKAKGKAEVCLLGEEYSGKWSLDGEDFTFKQAGTEYLGTLEDGVLVLDFAGLEYTFVKEGMEDEAEEEEEEEEEEEKDTEAETVDPPAAAVEEAGYWTLSAMEQDGQAVGEDEIAAMREMGIEIFLVLNEDGTGILMAEEAMAMTWGDGKIAPVEDPEDFVTYSIVDGALTLEQDGAVMTFVRGEGEPPAVEIPAAPPVDVPADPPVEAAGPYDIWEGDWYGWWIVWNGYGAYSDFTDQGWDCCAHVDVDGETGTFTMWDDTCAEGEGIVEVDVEFSVGMTEYGTMKSVSGTFLDAEIEAGEWNIDQGASNMNEFEDMMVIEGTYVDPANADDCFEYIIILRPWGADWEDVRAADHSEHYYDDMMSFRYDDWYMPLVEAGFEEAPASFDEGYEMLAGGSAPASGDALASGANDAASASLVGLEQVVDSDGDDAVRLYIEYTNKSDEPESAFMALDVVVMQNGAELERGYVWDEEYYVPEGDYYSDDILPGVTVRTAVEYKFDPAGGDLEIVVSEWWNEDVLFEYNADPGNLPGAPKSQFVIAQDWDADDFAHLDWEGTYADDYYIVIDTAEIVEGAWSDRVLRVYFQFTNNSDEATSFWSETTLSAFQNGIQVSSWEYPNDEIPEDDNDDVDVAPGETITVCKCIEIVDDTPIQIYLHDYYGDGLACTFELG